jgi:TRAP-type C4-dicarboxylate transport system permease small subunit
MRKMNDFLMGFCKVSIIIMVPIMTAIIFMQVLLRYVFKSPLTWPEELARYFLIWISCLGSAYAVREGMHISVVFIKNKLPQSYQAAVTIGTHLLVISFYQAAVTIGTHLLVISFFTLGVIQGFKLSFSQWIELTAALRLPMTYPTLAIPVGFGIMIMFSLELLIQDIKEFVSANKRTV